MLHNLKKNLRVDSEIQQPEIVIGENMKISKKETKDPSREHDFTHVYQKL